MLVFFLAAVLTRGGGWDEIPYCIDEGTRNEVSELKSLLVANVLLCSSTNEYLLSQVLLDVNECQSCCYCSKCSFLFVS